jgi:hypothetical protein
MRISESCKLERFMKYAHMLVRSSVICGVSLSLAIGCQRDDAQRNGSTENNTGAAPVATDRDTTGSMGTTGSGTATGTPGSVTGTGTSTGSTASDRDRMDMAGAIQRTAGHDEPMGTGGTGSSKGGHAGSAGSGGHSGSGGHAGSSSGH